MSRRSRARAKLRSSSGPTGTRRSRAPERWPASAPPAGPRELVENVEWADWTPDGKDMLIVRSDQGKSRLEYPAGKVLYETRGWIGSPRLSRRGDHIAFIDHPAINDDGGTVAILDLAGKKTTISPVFATAAGLAWSPEGSEVWYTAAEVGGNRTLHSSTPSGRTRTIARVAGTLTLHDVSADGRVLISHDAQQQALAALGPGASKEVDLSWLDWSLFSDISTDGQTVIFTETEKAEAAATRSTCAASTGRRPFDWARATLSRFPGRETRAGVRHQGGRATRPGDDPTGAGEPTHNPCGRARLP